MLPRPRSSPRIVLAMTLGLITVTSELFIDVPKNRLRVSVSKEREVKWSARNGPSTPVSSRQPPSLRRQSWTDRSEQEECFFDLDSSFADRAAARLIKTDHTCQPSSFRPVRRRRR